MHLMPLSSRILAILACVVVGSGDVPSKPDPKVVTEKELKAVAEEISALVKGYEGAAGVGFILSETASPKLVKRVDGKVVAYDKLGCGPFASAVLRRVLTGSYAGMDQKLHQAFGGSAVAAGYSLASSGRWKLTEFLSSALPGPKPKGWPADGVYFFDLRNDAGWADGSKTAYDKAKGMEGHVGFVVLSGGAPTTYQASQFADGIAVGVEFVKWAKATDYAKSKPGKESQMELYYVKRP